MGRKTLTIDSSVSAVFAFEVLDAKDFRVKNTMEALASNLRVKTEVGGLARYQNDHYRRISTDTPGNPWFISTLRLARWHIAAASKLEQLAPAMEILKWTAKNTLPSGALGEQLDPNTGKPISATPLLWSHAEYVIAVSEYVSRFQELAAAPQIDR